MSWYGSRKSYRNSSWTPTDDKERGEAVSGHGLSVISGLDPAAVLRAAQLDRPQVVAEEVERAEQELHIVRRVWVFGYVFGQRVLDTMIEGSVAHLDSTSLLMMRADTSDVDAAVTTWGESLDLAWMPIGESIEPTSSPEPGFYATTAALIPDSNIGPIAFAGVILFILLMVLFG